ncbi:MAG: hypothetical protein J0M15_14420 [Deltaproteobacteria bacterium]|jgi:uncharacterized membrane protein|nr:hypothetical protein [Deltaproteobacteria bacterium]
MKKGIKIVLLLVFLVMLEGCGKVKNSSSSDVASASGTEAFVAAKQVVADKCLSCHSAWTSYSEADYISKNLVTKKNPTNSSIYNRIRGNDTGTAGDMPQSNPNLSQSEMQLIKTWINNIE